MDKALTFMRDATTIEIRESGEPLVDLSTFTQGGARWRVAGSATGELGAAFIRESLVTPFATVAQLLNESGFEPIVMYAYRTPAMQRSLLTSDRVLDQVVDRVIWELGRQGATPERAYERLTVLCANSFANGTHLSGTAVDLMIGRSDGSGELDLGGPYLELSEITPMESPFIHASARHNRDFLTSTLGRAGFYPYPFEFWHYSRDDVYGVLLGYSHGPVTFGPVDVDVRSGEVTPVDRPVQEIVQRDELLDLLSDRLSTAKPKAQDGTP